MTISANFPAINPSLLLDFANTKALDPRITFSRPTTATYYDNHTTVVAEQNLLRQSQTFGTSPWGIGSITVTANTTTAPDGTSTAFSLIPTATTAQHFIGQEIAFAATAYTCSIYAKPNGYNFVQLNHYAAGIYANFDVSGGTVTQSSGTTSTSITSVGNGWYRCSMTYTSAATNYNVLILPITSGTVGSFPSETTNGTSGIFVWGAQVEQRSSVTAYTPTTTTAITNYIPVLQTAAINAPRFDFNPTTGESLGLLIEEQRTNLILQSQFASGWTYSGASGVLASDIAPDGTQTAGLLIPDTTLARHRVYQNATVVTATSYTMSIYVKAFGYTKFALREDASTGSAASFDLSTGTVLVGGSSASITSVGNSWYKCTFTSTSSGTSFNLGIQALPNTYQAGDNIVGTWTGNGYSGIYIWGAQLEAGAFPTSYIPTVASQVTRSADAASMTGTNFSSWYNISQGTLYAEIKPMSISATSYGVFTFDDGTGNNTVGLTTYSGNGQLSYAINGSGSGYLTTNPITLGQTAKISGSFAQYSSAIDLNGGTVVTGTTNTVPTVTTARIGYSTRATQYLNGTIKKLAYYPIALSNAELQEITS